MDIKYLEPHINFVISLEYLLAPKINISDLDKIEKAILFFVTKVSDIYPEQLMLSGMHELLHLVDITKKFGNLNSMNLFQFETLNRHLMSLIHGKYLVGEEFILNYNLLQGLCSYAENLEENGLLDKIKIGKKII